MSDRVPDWKLERYLLHELPPEEMAYVERLLAEQEASRQRLATLEADNSASHQRYPAAWMARQIQLRAAHKPTEAGRAAGQFGRAWRWSPALAIGLVALVALPLMQEPAPEIHARSAEQVRAEQVRVEQVRVEQVRVKGAGARLVLHRQLEAGGSARLAERDLVNNGDLVMIQYDAAGASHGLIFSIDGHGVVTRHLPLTGDRATSLSAGLASLTHAYELDDAPAWECFYLVTGDEAFDVAPILAAARGQDVGAEPPGALNLPDDLAQIDLAQTHLAQTHLTLLKAGSR